MRRLYFRYHLRTTAQRIGPITTGGAVGGGAGSRSRSQESPLVMWSRLVATHRARPCPSTRHARTPMVAHATARPRDDGDDRRRRRATAGDGGRRRATVGDGIDGAGSGVSRRSAAPCRGRASGLRPCPAAIARRCTSRARAADRRQGAEPARMVERGMARMKMASPAHGEDTPSTRTGARATIRACCSQVLHRPLRIRRTASTWPPICMTASWTGVEPSRQSLDVPASPPSEVEVERATTGSVTPSVFTAH